MVETEHKKVVREYYKDVPVKAVCDGCGKEEKKLPENWYGFTASHNDWGNDSIDSIKRFHCCSAECYINSLEKAEEEYRDYSSTEIDEKPLKFIQNLLAFHLDR